MRQWLMDARKAKGLTQAKVAREAGIRPPSYYAIEQGTRNPCVATAKRIAGVVGFEWTRFFEVGE